MLDPVTAALRHMMRQGGDDAARQRVLLSLLARKLVAATWPGPAEAVRTLTNRAGEQAMPLFTGMDALQASATRFGWVNPDGSGAHDRGRDRATAPFHGAAGPGAQGRVGS